ncbi:MFS family permease [Thermocatellispora tengchongensis]|uniref:MFS family permease n=1 Tax=Thermocatellispora tengchongensis TaxID=1073253 RepID=A0A840P288_9ACTN|nr:MFS transporter [Thermocatellispora tengchongensis]MBB5132606.1 MFS family permease [Thermocatellispora tengchongensis]
MTRDLRQARIGAIFTFVLAGLLCGTFTVRIPALVDRLGLTEAHVGGVLLAWGIGALVTMQSMRRVMAYAGSRAVLRIGGPLCAAALVLVAMAPGLPALLAASAVFGLTFGTVDIAMNAQGSIVERRAGRPLMNGMHAGWCVGAISAGVLGTAAIAAGMSFEAHLTVTALVAMPLMVLTGRWYLPEPRVAAAASGARGPRRRLPGSVYLLGLIAFCAFMVEGTVADWNGLFLRDAVGAPEAVAALGYPVFEFGMLLGRLGGDRLRTRFGARALLVGSGLITAVTFTAVITTPVVGVAVASMLLVGLGVATITPLALSLAGTATATPGPSIAQTATMGYAGLLLGPVLIGFLAEHASLRTAMFTAVVLGALIAVTARFLPATAAARDHEAVPAGDAKDEHPVAA